MDKSLLDTDIFSEVLKAKNPSVVQIARTYRQQFARYTISAVTVTEMVKGFEKMGRDDLTGRLATALLDEDILPLDRESAVLAGRIYGQLEKSGLTIGRADPMIAGIALQHGLVLVTGNTKHFERIVDLGFPLALQDWRVGDSDG